MSLFGNRNAAGPHKKSALAGALGVSSIYAGVRAAKGKSVSYKGAAAGGAALGAARGSGTVATRTAMALGKKGTAAVGKQAARRLVAKRVRQAVVSAVRLLQLAQLVLVCWSVKLFARLRNKGITCHYSEIETQLPARPVEFNILIPLASVQGLL